MGKPRTFRVRSHNQLMNQTAPRISFWKNLGNLRAANFGQEREGNKTMNTTTSVTYPVFAFVLACFALSPQAFAVAPPTLSPPNSSGCRSSTSVTICCPDQNAKPHVWGTGVLEADCTTRCCTINVYHPSTTTLSAYCTLNG